MLFPIRQCARRALPAVVRPLSSSSRVANALTTPPTTPAAATSILSSSPMFPSSSAPAPVTRPEQVTLMDIPPVEDPLLHFLASCIQKHGNRKRATRIVSRTLLWLHTFTRGPPLEMLREAILMAAPAVRCTHQVLAGHKSVPKPIALSEKQRTRQAIQWILKASDHRSGQTLEERLAREIVSILQGDIEKNAVLKQKKQAHEYAMVNRGSAEARV